MIKALASISLSPMHTSAPVSPRGIAAQASCARTWAALTCVLFAAGAWQSTQAQTATPIGESANGAASLLQAQAARYKGSFAAPCQLLAEGLYARDLIDLTPANTQVKAQYHKAMYTDADCTPAGLLVTMHLPPVTWQIDGSTVVQGQQADRVTITISEGLVTVTPAKPDFVRQTAEHWVLRIGKEELPINKLAEGSIDKDLRQIRQDTLLIGDPENTGADGYPLTLIQPPFTRQSIKPAP